jgi:hypothetical protein
MMISKGKVVRRSSQNLRVGQQLVMHRAPAAVFETPRQKAQWCCAFVHETLPLPAPKVAAPDVWERCHQVAVVKVRHEARCHHVGSKDGNENVLKGTLSAPPAGAGSRERNGKWMALHAQGSGGIIQH